MKNPDDLDPSALLAKIAQQDQVAFSQLYDCFAGLVFSIAYRILASKEEAEEVVLDVFNQVWLTADRYDRERGRVDTWLSLLARSRALDRLRKLQRQSRTVEASEQVAKLQPQGCNQPETDLLQQDQRERVQQALSKIPQEQRLVLELAYFQGMTHPEIAQETGQALGTIKTRIRLGLGKLRGILQQD
jgi:RNA polymerase sigma factor (sigma-70 family)